MLALFHLILMNFKTCFVFNILEDRSQNNESPNLIHIGFIGRYDVITLHGSRFLIYFKRYSPYIHISSKNDGHQLNQLVCSFVQQFFDLTFKQITSWTVYFPKTFKGIQRNYLGNQSRQKESYPSQSGPCFHLNKSEACHLQLIDASLTIQG